MTLEDFVLTYKGENSDQPLITIAEYYERYVKPLSKRFENSSLITNNTAICCFHNDTDPSLGTIRHKTLKGVRIYHCFGCGAAGTVIRMHQRIEKEYHHRELTEKEAALDLCKLWGIDASEYEGQTAENTSKYVDNMRRIDKMLGSYTVRDYADELISARDPNIPIEKRIQMLNLANVKMIATKKKLYD